MSDNEMLHGGDDDLSLPRATVQKIIQEMLPNEMICAKDTVTLIIDCCVEFIHLISSQANDICEKESRKTIAPEHILAALKELGFDSYVQEVESVLKEHKVQQKEREKKSNKLNKSEFTEEELLRQQEALFAASRARFQGRTQ
ncbi:histone-fold-containing protein [Dacryopinax primogenitus]|uniref:Histone-fold-containing protein n=1 Tax=Dacryopinax primogenitus (strain DJM 731) TaxID=1858805 RepID=M5FWC2_DACPD|nr:histone-fold-containing protein [Dacryopinax primogenitus]EJT97681.1 histone-fold-containing protein [Dacryopinax primogenitus]